MATECEEVAANFPRPERRLSFGEALKIVNAQMPDETSPIRSNVAEALAARSRALFPMASFFDKEQLLRVLFYHMTQETREMLKSEVPGAYWRYCGRDAAAIKVNRGCAACAGRLFIFADRDDGFVAIEACDNCTSGREDTAAATQARLIHGIVCAEVYPHYVLNEDYAPMRWV